MSYSNLIKRIWRDIYAPNADIIQTVDQYFHEDYEQSINGISMKRTEYIEHVLEQKKAMTIEKIEYKHIIEKENQLFALYYPRGRNTNNQELEAEVIAYFCFIKSKLISIHGQVRLIKGDVTDVDMRE